MGYIHVVATLAVAPIPATAAERGPVTGFIRVNESLHITLIFYTA